MAGGLGHGIGSPQGPQKPPTQPSTGGGGSPSGGGTKGAGGPPATKPTAPIAKTPAPTATTKTITKGIGGITTEARDIWSDLKKIFTWRPSWYQGVWPISNLAATIRDGEFAMMSDLNKWPYNSQTFTGFNAIVTFAGAGQITVSTGVNVVAWVTDAAGNVYGTETLPFANPLALQLGGTYLLSGNYNLNIEFQDPNSSLGQIYTFPPYAMNAVAMKQGITVTEMMNAFTGWTVNITVSNGTQPVAGVAVTNFSIAPVGRALNGPNSINRAAPGTTDSSGQLTVTGDDVLDNTTTYMVAAAAAGFSGQANGITAQGLNQGLNLAINQGTGQGYTITVTYTLNGSPIPNTLANVVEAQEGSQQPPLFVSGVVTTNSQGTATFDASSFGWDASTIYQMQVNISTYSGTFQVSGADIIAGTANVTVAVS